MKDDARARILPPLPDPQLVLRYLMTVHELLDWAPVTLVPPREAIEGLRVHGRRATNQRGPYAESDEAFGERAATLPFAREKSR